MSISDNCFFITKIRAESPTKIYINQRSSLFGLEECARRIGNPNKKSSLQELCMYVNVKAARAKLPALEV
jgi:hypothetical protein